MHHSERAAADLIASARSRARLSQAEVARRAGMTRSVVNAYERGRRQPQVDALVRVLDAAGYELDLVPSVRHLDEQRAARILSQVLSLAGSLPSRTRGALESPPFRRLVS
jgi:transcriptional regulator with XRE-family HTH domain